MSVAFGSIMDRRNRIERRVRFVQTHGEDKTRDSRGRKPFGCNSQDRGSLGKNGDAAKAVLAKQKQLEKAEKAKAAAAKAKAAKEMTAILARKAKAAQEAAKSAQEKADLQAELQLEEAKAKAALEAIRVLKQKLGEPAPQNGEVADEDPAPQNGEVADEDPAARGDPQQKVAMPIPQDIKAKALDQAKSSCNVGAASSSDCQGQSFMSPLPTRRRPRQRSRSDSSSDAPPARRLPMPRPCAKIPPIPLSWGDRKPIPPRPSNSDGFYSRRELFFKHLEHDRLYG